MTKFDDVEAGGMILYNMAYIGAGWVVLVRYTCIRTGDGVL